MTRPVSSESTPQVITLIVSRILIFQFLNKHIYLSTLILYAIIKYLCRLSKVTWKLTSKVYSTTHSSKHANHQGRRCWQRDKDHGKRQRNFCSGTKSATEVNFVSKCNGTLAFGTSTWRAPQHDLGPGVDSHRRHQHLQREHQLRQGELPFAPRIQCYDLSGPRPHDHMQTGLQRSRWTIPKLERYQRSPSNDGSRR